MRFFAMIPPLRASKSGWRSRQHERSCARKQPTNRCDVGSGMVDRYRSVQSKERVTAFFHWL
jgi:hypothetical protein